ncbi:MAG: hypothetical protein KJ890_01805 [Gammaproteobacteria bacterium]|nr:hypothetical protein [Gammaproteobacteria bacterium]MBU1805016.1 hypothetical protein [Gammaproteobacteria bacterium]
MDVRRVLFFIGAAFISIVAGYTGQSLIKDNANAISIITDVFSILAGFLMTVLTLLIEPKPTARIWREAAATKRNFVHRLVRYKWLFMLYLIVLAMGFLITLLKDGASADIQLWAERIYLGLACLAFIISLTLPSQLMNLQVSRYNEMIEELQKRK